MHVTLVSCSGWGHWGPHSPSVPDALCRGCSIPWFRTGDPARLSSVLMPEGASPSVSISKGAVSSSKKLECQ